MSPKDQPGARSVTGRRRSSLPWLPWVALALLVLVALVSFLVVRNVADDDDRGGVDVNDDREQGAAVYPASATPAVVVTAAA